MTERINNKKITDLVAAMVRQGMDVGLDGQYGRFRVTNFSGDQDLSGRGTNREIYEWLHAYRNGRWDLEHEITSGKVVVRDGRFVRVTPLDRRTGDTNGDHLTSSAAAPGGTEGDHPTTEDSTRG